MINVQHDKYNLLCIDRGIYICKSNGGGQICVAAEDGLFFVYKMMRDSDGETGDSKKRPLQVSMTYALHCLFVNTAVIPI